MIDIYLFFHHRQRLVRFLCECYEKWRSLTFFFCGGDLFRSSENLTFSLGYKCFQLSDLVSKVRVKVTAIIVSDQYGEQMQRMNKVSYVFEEGVTFGFFDQDCTNLTNVLKYSNVNSLNFKPLAPKQLIWARQLGTEMWSKINRRTGVREWDTPA